jgi:hypothetical protein
MNAKKDSFSIRGAVKIKNNTSLGIKSKIQKTLQTKN